MKSKKKESNIITIGKKKRATARVVLKKSSDTLIRINSTPLENWGSEIMRSLISEVTFIAKDHLKGFDAAVNVSGGGSMGQAYAIRTSLARSFVEFSKDKKLKDALLKYDNKVIAGDSRVKEVRKPNRSKARAKRQKSYR